MKKDSYRTGTFIKFYVFEPKKRAVLAAKFKDRQLQRSLIKNYLYDEITRHFIYDNHACQVGKGTSAARKRLKVMIEKAYRQWGKDTYVYTFDIAGFFPNTRHDVAKKAIKKRVHDEWAVSMVNMTIDAFCGETGIGLGSDEAQFIELSVLDDLDHYVKEQLHVHYYIRYMDDFIIFCNSKERLKMFRNKIEEQLIKIGLQLHPKKCHLTPINKGIIWLGFRYRQTETGKIIVTLPKKKIIRERRKLKKIVGLVRKGRLTRNDADHCFKSWKSHAKYGDNHTTIKKMTKYYQSLWRDKPCLD